MRGLKQVRLVYRQHLLPPVVLPLDRLSDYQLYLQKEDTYGNIQFSKKDLGRVNQIHETIITQLYKFKERYIRQLKHCPFYYEHLDQAVRKAIFTQKYQGKSYREMLQQIDAAEAHKVYKKYINQYNKYVGLMEVKDKDFMQNIQYIPIFIYESPEQLALAAGKEWASLSALEIVKWKNRYQKKLTQHWEGLKQISVKSSLQLQELIRLTRTQLRPEVSSGLSSLLFL